MPTLATSLLDRVLGAAVAANGVPGAVAAVTDGTDVLYEGATGTSQTAAGRPMAPGTVFRIASMTKLVTSLAVMLLREAEEVELDAPFGRYFPGYRQPPVLETFDRAELTYTTRPARSEITVRQLLTHTSGYGYWFLAPELCALTTGAPEYYDPPFLMHEPGTRFRYGISTDVLGQLIAPVTGQSLPAFLSTRIFEPLGMRDTSFARPADARLASIHAQTSTGFVELPADASGDGPRGGGALYSTASDFLALLRMLLRNGAGLLEPATVAAMTRNQIGPLFAERQTSCVPQRTADFLFMNGAQKFGFGVLIETAARPSGRAAGSYSWGGIYNTYFWVDPRAGIATVVFMQASPFSAPACIDVCERFERAVYEALES